MSNEAYAIFLGMHAKAQYIWSFMNGDVRPRVDRASSEIDGFGAFRGQFYRANAWMYSIARLIEPADFQPTVAGARALLEIAIDSTLMHHDATTYPWQKLNAWEESAKLKQAQKVADFYQRTGQAPSGEHDGPLRFLRTDRQRVEQLRGQYWTRQNGRPYHPMRWTGRGLDQDAQAAEQLSGESFREFYELRYGELCWNTHGSGTAGFAGVSPEVFPFIGGRALDECVRFSMVATKIIARHLRLWPGELDHVFNDAQARADAACRLAYGEIRSRE